MYKKELNSQNDNEIKIAMKGTANVIFKNNILFLKDDSFYSKQTSKISINLLQNSMILLFMITVFPAYIYIKNPTQLILAISFAVLSLIGISICYFFKKYLRELEVDLAVFICSLMPLIIYKEFSTHTFLAILLPLLILTGLAVWYFFKEHLTTVEINLRKKNIRIIKKIKKKFVKYETHYNDELKIKVVKSGVLDIWQVVLYFDKKNFSLQALLGVAQSKSDLNNLLLPYKDKILIIT